MAVLIKICVAALAVNQKASSTVVGTMLFAELVHLFVSNLWRRALPPLLLCTLLILSLSLSPVSGGRVFKLRHTL